MEGEGKGRTSSEYRGGQRCRGEGEGEMTGDTPGSGMVSGVGNCGDSAVERAQMKGRKEGGQSRSGGGYGSVD